MLTINLPGQRQPVSVQSIVWLKGEANYTWVHQLDGHSLIVSQPLGWFEDKLNFIRVHRSAIVNPIYVQEFKQKRGRTGWIQLSDGTLLSVARNRLEYTANQLKQVEDTLGTPESHTEGNISNGL
ncbi:LytR/AlgR family response regulator transcription factor [Spirosoma utsteinense]|uniref:DNA-binding LytR/AlgR family response regulator n=1 Tax=Spirosoma utsteinense TaxID=2585773 RepID=A0ABR6W852_9BACT|nr:LytTR family DNA-binding domain-containing protein [Spirosoma utsteinense]MBC3787704.1 DNA-binding LytR/AlgR family response regulator [Spirosoma utsteinense]MBC3792692.1 DNA-binding LytR/AlgR family response regulator [Spirosoma utsteinense]